MNKELLFKIAKITPKSIRNIIKKFYDPIIPEISKVDYGEILMPKENLGFMLKALIKISNDKIEGEFESVVGLPKELTRRLIQEALL